MFDCKSPNVTFRKVLLLFYIIILYYFFQEVNEVLEIIQMFVSNVLFATYILTLVLFLLILVLWSLKKT